jgi:hypothetical protein
MRRMAMTPAKKVLLIEPDDDVEALILRHPNGDEEEIAVLGPDEGAVPRNEGDAGSHRKR